MKKIFFIIAFTIVISFITNAQLNQLKGVTFGLGIGVSYLTKAPNDYYLTPDAAHKLQVQNLNKGSIVISSMLNIKLGNVATQTKYQQNGTTRKQLVSMNRYTTNDNIRTANTMRTANATPRATADKDSITYEDLTFKEKLSLHLSLNLAQINSNSIAFNTSIDGGIGIGYLVNTYTHVAIFYDMLRVRQLRDYIVDTYKDKSIPNGTEVLNALDPGNPNLFYNKYFSGVSVKIIFALGQ